MSNAKKPSFTEWFKTTPWGTTRGGLALRLLGPALATWSIIVLLIVDVEFGSFSLLVVVAILGTLCFVLPWLVERETRSIVRLSRSVDALTVFPSIAATLGAILTITTPEELVAPIVIASAQTLWILSALVVPARPAEPETAAEPEARRSETHEMDATADAPDVRFAVEGALGAITLDRPRALNALTHEMVLLIAAQLDAWEGDPAVERVLITGAGDRAFCAGGDIVGIYRDALAGGTETQKFWRDEYALNARIARYPKPIITFMDGIVLGGGVGLGAHASHRIVTETSRVGMPETTIGFVPDVGGTWLLSHAPGELGTRMALAAESVDAASAIHVGFADYLVPRERLPALRQALATRGPDAAIPP